MIYISVKHSFVRVQLNCVTFLHNHAKYQSNLCNRPRILSSSCSSHNINLYCEENKKCLLQNNVAAKFIVPVHGTVRASVSWKRERDEVIIKRISRLRDGKPKRALIFHWYK